MVIGFGLRLVLFDGQLLFSFSPVKGPFHDPNMLFYDSSVDIHKTNLPTNFQLILHLHS